MPSAYVKKVHSETGIPMSKLEEYWNKAKKIAKKTSPENYALITGIFKNMVGVATDNWFKGDKRIDTNYPTGSRVGDNRNTRYNSAQVQHDQVMQRYPSIVTKQTPTPEYNKAKFQGRDWPINKKSTDHTFDHLYSAPDVRDRFFQPYNERQVRDRGRGALEQNLGLQQLAEHEGQEAAIDLNGVPAIEMLDRLGDQPNDSQVDIAQVEEIGEEKHQEKEESPEENSGKSVKVKFDVEVELEGEIEVSLSGNESDWWKGLTKNQKISYIKKHPASKYAKAVRKNMQKRKAAKQASKIELPSVPETEEQMEEAVTDNVDVFVEETSAPEVQFEDNADTVANEVEAVESNPSSVSKLATAVRSTISNKIGKSGIGKAMKVLSGNAKDMSEQDLNHAKKTIAVAIGGLALIAGGTMLSMFLGPGIAMSFANEYVNQISGGSWSAGDWSENPVPYDDSDFDFTGQSSSDDVLLYAIAGDDDAVEFLIKDLIAYIKSKRTVEG